MIDLVGKAKGISMAFRLAEIGILESSKRMWVGLMGARLQGHGIATRCDALVLAHSRSITVGE